MNKLKKYTAMALILIMTLSCFVYGNAIKAQAASTQFSISLSSSSVSKGGSVTVTVSVSCSEALGAYSYCLSYDSSVLEYTSGDGYGGGGTISCAGYGDGNIKSASNSFTFSAIASGSSYVGTGSSDVYTWGEESCSISNAGATITVTAAGGGNNGGDSTTQAPATTQEQGSTEAGSTTESGESTEDTEDTSEETTEEMSDNCFLSSLQITPGELKPEFSKDVYSYETTVPGETTSLAINALPEDSKSSVSIEGNENFEPGKQAHVTIKVTAETGDTHIYDLMVNVEEIVDTRAVINVNGTDYYFSQDYGKISVPEGFAQSKEKFGDTEIILYTSPNGQIKCAYLTDKDGKNGAWYIIDLDAKTAVPLINVQSAYKNFIILEPDDSVSKPEGYSSFSYDFDGNTVTAYHVTENDEIILVYAMSPDSDPSWHRYDTVEKTFVRYTADPATEKQEEAATGGSFFDQHKDKVLTICIVVVVVMFFLIIILACMLVRVIRKGLPEDDEPDDPNDPDKMSAEDIEADAIDDAGESVESETGDDVDDSVDAHAGDGTGESVESNAGEDVNSDAIDIAGTTVNPTATSDAINADSNNSEDSEQLVLNEASDKDSIEASSIPEIKAETDSAESDTVDSQDTTEETVATDTTEAEQPEPDANASVKETAAATHDGMTELKAEPAAKAENITSTRLSADAKKEQELTPAEEIVKKAAQYSSMNTADLSEVFNMAEAIINHEDPKKNTGSLQFKPIKQNASEGKKEK